MTQEQFEDIAEEAFHNLPEKFKEAIDNVEIVIEDIPTGDDRRFQGGGGKLLGLYKGVPLPNRGTWYGMTPTLPDRIILYKNNIEEMCRGEKEIRHQIYVTLYHELGHYFGMTEGEIRRSMEDDADWFAASS